MYDFFIISLCMAFLSVFIIGTYKLAKFITNYLPERKSKPATQDDIMYAVILIIFLLKAIK